MFDRLRTNHPLRQTEADTTTQEKPSRFTEADDLENGVHSDGLGWADPYGPRPTVKRWFRLYWHDLVGFIFLGALALGLLLWSPVPYNKYFTVTQDYLDRRSDVVAPMFAHPKRSQYVPIIADALAACFTPIVSIILLNFFGIGTYSSPGRLARGKLRGSFLFGRGSFWNVNNGFLGVIYAVLTGAVLQIIIKLAVPGLRPHFLTVCDPQIPADGGEGYRGLYYTARVCRDYKNREDLIANAMQSFPSGHATAAWAGLFYCALYLNAHLKIFANYHPSYWKLLVFCVPLCGATLLAGALSLDMSHNWYDIVAGSLLGIATATAAYRMGFASVWDYRWNHVPLVRHGEGLRYTGEEMVEFMGGVGTRSGGWGTAGGRVLGAPGDFLRDHGLRRHAGGHVGGAPVANGVAPSTGTGTGLGDGTGPATMRGSGVHQPGAAPMAGGVTQPGAAMHRERVV